MLTEGLSRQSIVRKVHAILSSAFEVQVGARERRPEPVQVVMPPAPAQSDQARLTQAEVRAVAAAAAGRPNAVRWSVGLACGLRQGEVLGLRWRNVGPGHPLARRPLPASAAAVAARLRGDKKLKAITDPKLRKKRIAEILAACTEGEHRRPCPKRCPKKARKSGRPHQCIPEDAARLCPADCQGHASTCPQRRGGGLVFREIKEKRRKRVRLPRRDRRADAQEHRDAQYLQRLTADREWEDGDLVFCQWNGRPDRPAPGLGGVVRDPQGGRAASLPAALDAALDGEHRAGEGHRPGGRPGDARPLRCPRHPRLHARLGRPSR